MKLAKFMPFKAFNRSKRKSISQLSFSELRIAEKRKFKNRFSRVLVFLSFLPVYFNKKQQRVALFINSIANLLISAFGKVKSFVVIKLIWGRGRLSRPILHIGTLFLISTVFLTGGVFQKNLIVLSNEEREVYVSSKSDIVPQTVVVSTDLPNARPRDTVITYTVRTGDTLSSIGKNFGITVDTIRYANNIADIGYLKVGQKLEIPPVTGLVHEVKSGDTIQSLAEEYNVNVQAIADFNYLAPPFDLAVGQQIILPDAKIPAPVPKAPTVAQSYDGSAYTFVPNAGSGNTGSGQFVWPTVSRYISQYFSWYHPALDIAIPGPIFAADSGVVVRSGWWANGYGFAIQVDHRNGYVTTYAHMSRLDVSVGDNVERGQTIGMMGSTGRSTGPHVHFTIQQNGQFLNPLDFY